MPAGATPRGDTSDDVRLQPGDVVFIPPVGPVAGVSGEVRRPAIYELRGDYSVGDLVSLAGGFLPSAFPEVSRLERFNARGLLTVLDVDLRKTPAYSAPGFF